MVLFWLPYTLYDIHKLHNFIHRSYYLDLPEFSLIYWDEEQSVSATKTTNLGSDTLVIGDNCSVTFGGTSYHGQLAAQGLPNTIIKLLL